MGDILFISKNILKLIFRKKTNTVLYIFLPVIVTVVMAMLFSSIGGQAISIGIIDNDNSTLSNSYREFIENSGKYNMNEINAEEMNEKISTGEIAFCAAIPESFQASILKGENAKIEIYSIKGTEVTAWVDNFTTIYMQNIAKLSLVADGDIDKFTSMVNSIKDGEVKLLKTELQDELIGKYALKQIIGLLLFFMMMASATTASFIIKEKKERTYYRIYVGPISQKAYLIGNVIVNMFITTMQILLIIKILTDIIKIEIQMSPIVLFIILESFAFVIVSIGLVIAAFSKNDKMVNAVSPLILTPSCMLAGCFWDISFMPDFLKKLALLMPQRWVMEAIEKMQGNSELVQIIPELVIILAFAVTIFLIAAYRIKHTQRVSM